MVRDIPDADRAPELGDDDVPFEAKPGAPVRARPRPRAPRPKKRSPAMAIGLLVYALGAAGIGAFDQEWWLLGWLVTGPLGLAIYRAIRKR